MGQFSPTLRLTSTWPNRVLGAYELMAPGAGIITIQYANEDLAAGGTNGVFDTALYWATDASGTGQTIFPGGSMTFSAFPGPVSRSWSTAGVPAGAYIAAEVNANTSGNTISLDVTYFDDLVYCAYGTRVQPGQQLVLVISEAAIAAAALLVPELGFLAVAWGALAGSTAVPGTWCASPPPPFPTFTQADFVFGTQIPAPGSLGKFFQAYIHTVWPLYCECIPASGGAPPAVPFPPIIPPTPPGVAPPPGPIVCDSADVCATLNAITRQLTSLTLQLTLTRADVQLIQRQGVPFGYILGPVHSALSGNGDFLVADILGLAVTFDVLPPTFVPRPGDPDTFHQLGKVSVGTVNGWERSWQPTHSPYLILPVSGAITKVGWTFAPGIVATITELIREG